MRAWWLLVVVGSACGKSGTSPPSNGSGSAGSAAVAVAVAGSGSGSARVDAAPRPPEPPAASGSQIRWAPLTEPFHAVAVRAGDDRRCALSKAGEVACWGGRNVFSDEPAELKADRATPRRIVGVTGAIDVAMMSGWICIARSAGDGVCLRADTQDERVPAWTVPPVELGVSDNGSQRELCARLRDGTVACQGARGYGMHDASTIAGATSLSCAAGCCATTKDGLVCFGTGRDIGQTNEPAPLPGRGDAVDVALAWQYACVKTKAGGGSCWGVGRERVTEAAVRDVVAFQNAACAVKTDGTLSCSSSVPPLRDVVSGGGDCAVHTDGSIECWGAGYNGEHGDGRPVLLLTPTRVDVDHVIDVRVGEFAACALREDHALQCWGNVPTPPVARVASFANDLYSPTCGIASETEMACEAGEFRKELVTLDGGTVQSLAVGYHGRMVRVDKAGAVTWAYRTRIPWTPIETPAPAVEALPTLTGFYLRLVDGRIAALPPGKTDPRTYSVEMTEKPVVISGVSDAVQLATNNDGACVRTKADSVWCWKQDAPTPVEIEALRGASWISGSGMNFCAVVKGDVWCWGDTDDGQLGNGTIPPRIPETAVTERAKSPVRAKTTFVAARVVVGRGTVCAIDDKAQLWCWGSNRNGQLGFGRSYLRKTPVRVVGIGPR